MKINLDNLKRDEQIVLSLESIYESFGYRKFKMSSFEEYSMYLNNSDFLLSENVITFSSKSGKLLALRPDVTLSIVKNAKPNGSSCEKLYYSENVYRQLSQSGDFKEIEQTGVEIIGNIDNYSYVEVIQLALKSLETIGENYVLDVSNMNVISAFLSLFDTSIQEIVYELLKSKNIDDFKKLALQNSLSNQLILAFESLCLCHGLLNDSINYLENLKFNDNLYEKVCEFIELLKVLQNQENGDKLNINFSIKSNVDYYNGLIFNGFVNGIPKAVLSGGRYDKLLAKFNKKAGAIGFAVYIGEIERYLENTQISTDILIIYDDKADFNMLMKHVISLQKQGYSVRVDKALPQNFVYKKLMKFNEKGLN